jgi:alkylation response protein AidB-like acyl-CoA dehydrogenase
VTIDFSLSPELSRLRQRVQDFVNHVVVPAEVGAFGEHGPAADVIAGLREAARAAGAFAPTAPTEFGGLGLDHRAQAVVLEESGRSLLGPAAMNCAAPDEGNILLLDRIASAEQRKLFLEPLCRGAARSAFAMTEPAPGAGSDPGQLRTRAARTAAGWSITGHKWLITGAAGAAFFIVMARTSDTGASMFLVPAGHPGLRVTRHVPTIDAAFAGGHGELVFTDCEVGDDAVLGRIDHGFADAQVRLGAARLTHCMRWLGAARRAHETAVSYARTRPMLGSTLGEQGMAQRMIAENEIDIAASRGLIWQAAWALDQRQPARQETSVAKAFVAEAVYRVTDRSVQLAGGLGVSHDSPLPRLLQDARPFRIYDGPTETHYWAIGRRALRRSAAGQLPGDYPIGPS